MAGQIHRQKKTGDFVIMDTHALRNPSLSWKAKGIHGYLMQLPEDWKVNIADLSNRSKDERDGTAAGVKELIAAGYVVRVRCANPESGKFEGYDYHVFEQPTHAEEWKTENAYTVNGKSVNGKSVNGKSVNGKSVTTNNEVNQELKELTINNNNAEFLQNSSEGFTKKLESLLIEAGATFVDSPNYEAPQTKKSTPAPRTKKTAAISPEAAAAFAHFSDAAKIAESWGAWMRYKVSQFGAKAWYASPESETTALRKLWKDTNGDANKAAEIIYQSISNTWKGLFELKNTSTTNGSQIKYASKAAEQHASIAAYIQQQQRDQLARFYGDAVE